MCTPGYNAEARLMANPLIVKLGFGGSERVTKAVCRDVPKYILFTATYSYTKAFGVVSFASMISETH